MIDVLHMTPREFVLRQFPDALLVIGQTAQKTKLYCIESQSFPAPPGRGISCWCFSEDAAWQDAYQTLVKKGAING